MVVGRVWRLSTIFTVVYGAASTMDICVLWFYIVVCVVLGVKLCMKRMKICCVVRWRNIWMVVVFVWKGRRRYGLVKGEGTWDLWGEQGVLYVRRLTIGVVSEEDDKKNRDPCLDVCQIKGFNQENDHYPSAFFPSLFYLFFFLCFFQFTMNEREKVVYK